MSLIDNLISQNLIHPPSFLKNNVFYECMMGSEAYGVSSGESDIDIYGFCIPPKDIIFPHLKGNIIGFGKQPEKFNNFTNHNIKTKDNKKQYDISIYNIVRYFQLCMENTPNIIDSLFVPRRCILYTTQVGELVRENRHIFLHKGGWHKFKGYAFSQLHKMENKNIKLYVDICNKLNIDPETFDESHLESLKGYDQKILDELIMIYKKITKSGIMSKRIKLIKKHGYDTKFGYNVVRLLNEIEQIMIEGDLDLERNREQLKSIRRGEWSLNRIKKYFEDKEKDLEQLYTNSKLRYKPDEQLIKKLLLNCLEMHFGSLNTVFPIEKNINQLISEIQEVIDKY